MHRFSKGFLLIELLLTMVIFSIILIGVYSLFEQAQQSYFDSEKQTVIQQYARLVVEGMERDLRMIGSGVPAQGIVGSGISWTPYVFVAERSKLYFRADIDNRNTLLTADAASGTAALSVEDASLVCPDPGTSRIVLVRRLKQWQPLTCTSSAGGNISVSPTLAADFAAAETTVQTPETIFYRLSGDANGDGVCDIGFPFCRIERAEVAGNDPVADAAEPDTFSLAADNVTALKFQYLTGNGALIDGDAVPLSGGEFVSVQRIRVTVTVTNRSGEGPGKYQDATLATEVLVRDARY